MDDDKRETLIDEWWVKVGDGMFGFPAAALKLQVHLFFTKQFNNAKQKSK